MLNATWQETESEVWRPGMWLVLTVGLVFAMIGCNGLVMGVGPAVGMPVWARQLIIGTFSVAGCTLLGWAVRIRLWPVRIRHAVANSFPDLVNEPVLREGSTVHGRLTHELSENDAGWEFRPMTSIWRNDRWFLFGFGGPFLIVFAGILTWYFHQAMNWAVAGVLAVFLTTVSGGTCFVLIGLIMNAAHRRLSTLSIPRDRTDLVLDSAVVPDVKVGDLAAGLQWIFLGGNDRQQLAIPRERVVAVQLCPWKFVAGGSRNSTTTWAVQGLIVLARSDTGTYDRLPILLTSDFVGAARLMHKLGEVLQVPYLFGADAAGWKAEAIRARTRPPLKSGGMVS